MPPIRAAAAAEDLQGGQRPQGDGRRPGRRSAGPWRPLFLFGWRLVVGAVQQIIYAGSVELGKLDEDFAGDIQYAAFIS